VVGGLQCTNLGKKDQSLVAVTTTMLLLRFQSMLVTMILVVVEELVVVVATSVAMCAIICVTFCVWHTHEQFVECAMEYT